MGNHGFEFLEFRPTSHDIYCIAKDPRYVFQISVLSVADAEAVEDSNALQVALKTREVKPPQVVFLGQVVGQKAIHGQTLLVSQSLGADPFFVVVHVAIAQQGDGIVGDGSDERSLKVDYAGIAVLENQ